MTKRKSKKRKHDHPALNPYANPKIRREFIDIDYTDKLSSKDKDWLNKFMDEYNGANLDFKNSRKNLHKTKKLKKDCTDRVNSRNRDIYGRSKIKNELHSLNEDFAVESGNVEEAMVDYLDKKKSTLDHE